MAENLSSAGGRFFWYNTSDADNVAGMLKMSVKNPAEIYFDAMTGQLQSHGKIGLTNAGDVSKVRVNG